jgi:hypothetical protein
MKNILRALLFGAVLGVLLGIYFNERGHQRRAQEEADAIANDPEGKALLAYSRRLRQADQWLDDIEGDLDNA